MNTQTIVPKLIVKHVQWGGTGSHVDLFVSPSKEVSFGLMVRSHSFLNLQKEEKVLYHKIKKADEGCYVGTKIPAFAEELGFSVYRFSSNNPKITLQNFMEKIIQVLTG